MSRDPRGQRGNIGLAFLWMASLAVFLSMGFLPTVFTERQLQTRSSGSLTALATAEAGVERAIWEFNVNGNTFAAPWIDVTCPVETPAVTPPCRQLLNYQIGQAATSPPPPSLVTGKATVLVRNVNGTYPLVVSTGTAQGSAISTNLTVELMKNAGPPPFQKALMADWVVHLYGSSDVGSFDSATQTYCTGSPGFPCQGNVEVNRSNIYMNGTGANPATIDGNLMLDGIIDPSSTYGAVYGITSPQAPNPDLIYPVPPDPPDPATLTDPLKDCDVNLGAYSVTSTVTRPEAAGTIYCADSVSISGNVTLTFPANATLYVRSTLTAINSANLVFNGGTIRSGNFYLQSGSQLKTPAKTDFYVKGTVSVVEGSDLNNGTVASGGRRPERLRMWVQRDPAHAFIPDYVQLDSTGTEAYAVIYAPGMWVNIDNGVHLRGAIIAESVQLDNSSKLDYDTRLLAVTDWPNFGVGVKARSWKRNN